MHDVSLNYAAQTAEHLSKPFSCTMFCLFTHAFIHHYYIFTEGTTLRSTLSKQYLKDQLLSRLFRKNDAFDIHTKLIVLRLQLIWKPAKYTSLTMVTLFICKIWMIYRSSTSEVSIYSKSAAYIPRNATEQNNIHNRSYYVFLQICTTLHLFLSVIACWRCVSTCGHLLLLQDTLERLPSTVCSSMIPCLICGVWCQVFPVRQPSLTLALPVRKWFFDGPVIAPVH